MKFQNKPIIKMTTQGCCLSSELSKRFHIKVREISLQTRCHKWNKLWSFMENQLFIKPPINFSDGIGF